MSGVLQTFSQAFTAGQAVAWSVRAAHFRLLDGDAVDVRFFLNGAIVGFAEQVDSGFYLKSKDVFDKVEISSATAQTIKFTAGSAEAGAASSVSVSGTVAVSLPVAPLTQAAPAVGVASVQILAANSSRRFLMVQNTDPAVIVYLNLAGAAASVATGIKLAPGDALLLDICSPSAAIFAIASAVMSAALIVVEG